MKFRYAAIALAVAMLAGSQAEAGWGLGYGGCGFGGYGYGPYALGNVPTPPYFALHPPVYYGQVIHRTYGRSPFARGAGYGGYGYAAPAPRPRLVVNRYLDGNQQAANTHSHQGALVINPYVEQDAATAKLAHSTQPQPQMIINPFYKPEGSEEAVQQVARK